MRRLSDSLTLNNRLRILEIGDNVVDDEGMKLLAEALKTTSSLERLDIQENLNTHMGVEAITDALLTRLRRHGELELKWLRVDYAWLHLPEILGTYCTFTLSVFL